jgi:hypothetical protein
MYNLAQYRHFIILNSSVRGPFMPVYMRGDERRTQPGLAWCAWHGVRGWLAGGSRQQYC